MLLNQFFSITAVSRLSVREAITRALPLLLAGIGLPLAFAFPLPGIICLLFFHTASLQAPTIPLPCLCWSCLRFP